MGWTGAGSDGWAAAWCGMTCGIAAFTDESASFWMVTSNGWVSWNREAYSETMSEWRYWQRSPFLQIPWACVLQKAMSPFAQGSAN